jgi:hypothetical protein
VAKDPYLIGFYGCSTQLVRIGRRPASSRSRPKTVTVPCPACQREHRVQPLWRHRDSTDDPEAIDVEI